MGFGLGIIKHFNLGWGFLERGLFGAGIGSAFFAYCLFFVGTLGHLRLSLAISILVVMAIFGWSPILKVLPESIPLINRILSRIKTLFAGQARLSLFFLLLFTSETALNLINALAPVTEGDSLHSYLVAPKWWALEGHIGYVSNSHFNGLYGIAALLSSFGLLCGNDQISVVLVGFSFGLMGAFCVFAVARRLNVTRQGSLIAATLFVCLPDVWYQSATGKFDMAAVFFCLLALLTLLSIENPVRQAVWVGIFVGIGIWTQLGSVMIVPAILVYLFCTLHMNAGPNTSRPLRFLPHTFIFLIVVGLMLLPGSLLNWKIYHNPFYPMGIWPFIDKTYSSLNFSGNRTNWTYIYFGGSPWGFLKSMWYETFIDRFHGLGPWFVLFMPLFLWTFWDGDSRWKGLSGFSIIYLVEWNLLRQVPRDMLIVSSVNCVAIARSLTLPYSKKLENWGISVLRLILCICAGAMVAQNARNAAFYERFNFLLQHESKATYLARVLDKIDTHLPRWDIIEWSNRNIPISDVSVAYINPNLYYFDRKMLQIGDPIAQNLLHNLDDFALLKLLKDHNIMYIFMDRKFTSEPTGILRSVFLKRYCSEVFSNRFALIFRRNLN